MTTYYVSPTGDDGAAGTIGAPWRRLSVSFNRLTAGDILIMRGGTYTDMVSTTKGIYVSNKDGTAENLIYVQNMNGEQPILDCAGLTSSTDEQVGIHMNGCSYWYITGLEVKNVLENTNQDEPAAGWALDSCDQITLKNCSVHDCANGFVLWGFNGTILYWNCDAYQLHDHYDNGGLANGFNSNINASGNISYLGCRAWLCSDDGWDAFSVDYGSGTIYYKYCWAFENGAYGGVVGNGAGFKSGKSHLDPTSGIQRRFECCIASENTGIGFDESQDVNDPLDATSIPHAFYNCASYNNGEVGWNFSFGSGTNGFEVDIFRNCISYLDPVVMYENVNNTIDHNSWQNGLSVGVGDFISVNSAQLKNVRQLNGNLPPISFLHLDSTSDLRGAGEAISGLVLDTDGNTMPTPPDLGPFAYVTGEAPVLVTAITVTGTGGATTIASQGGTLQMLRTITPTNATNQNVTWTLTAGTGGGYINSSGLVTATADGTVTIRATAQDGSGVSGTLQLTFSNQLSVVLVTAVTVTGAGGATTITVSKGTLQLAAHIDPHDATNQNVIWSVIPGTGSATIDQTGLLTAVSDGTVTVRATAQDSI